MGPGAFSRDGVAHGHRSALDRLDGCPALKRRGGSIENSIEQTDFGSLISKKMSIERA
jgi:hypothetical protein